MGLGSESDQERRVGKKLDAFAKFGEDCGRLRARPHHDGQLSFSPLRVQIHAEEWFDTWRLINVQRIERYKWSSSGPNAEQAPRRPTIAEFRAIPARNHSRARRRCPRAQCLTPQDNNVEVWENDAHLVEPSHDESTPAESQDAPLHLPTFLSLPLSSLGYRITAQSMKRSGETLESGSTK